MRKTCQHTVPETVSPVRLSDYGAGIFEGLPSRAGFKKAIKRGEIFVNGKVGTTGIIVVPGMKISWHPRERGITKTYHTSLQVVFEDDYLAVVNKPGGIVVSGNRFRTLENALPDHLYPSPLPDILPAARAVHRLDEATGGLVIIAKTANARIRLGDQLENREVTKKYTVVVIGETPDLWESDMPVDNKEALTKFKKLYAVPSLVSGTLTMLEAQPVTGRKHQIRKHLWWNRLPVLGDKKYAHENFILKGKGLFLCATPIPFKHPENNTQLNFSVDPPPKFSRFLEGEKKRFLKYQK